jgi:hypothetical protein
MLPKITGFGPPRLSKAEVGFVAAASTLALISAVAFIALQYIQARNGQAYLGAVNRNFYSILTGTSFLVTTTVVLGILIARSLRYQNKEKKEETNNIPPELVSVAVQTDPVQSEPQAPQPHGADEPAPEPVVEPEPAPAQPVAPAATPEAPPVVSVETTHQALKSTIKQEVASFLNAADAIAATGCEIDTKKIAAQRGRLEQLIADEVSPQGFQQHAKRMILNELTHYAYIVQADKGWKKKKEFLDAGEKQLREDTELVHALTYFESLKGIELQQVIREAVTNARERGYASLSALGDLLDPGPIQDKAALERAIAGIPPSAYNDPARYTLFAKYAEQQVKNMMGLPVYLPAYLVMWQKWFQEYPVETVPVFGKKTLPELLSWKLAREGIKHSIYQKASTQLIARAPIFLRQNVNFGQKEGKILEEGAQFSLAEMMQALSRPILYTTIPGTGKAAKDCGKAQEKCGAYIADYFKAKESTYKPLKEAPFLEIPSFDSHVAVTDFTSHMKKFKK